MAAVQAAASESSSVTGSMSGGSAGRIQMRAMVASSLV